MKFNTFISDLDGTLVHTKPEYRYLVVGNALRDLGKEADNPSIDRFWFEAKRDEIIKQIFGVDPKLFWPIYYSYDKIELRAQFTELYPDVDFAKGLKSRGFKTGIVTGAPLHIASLEVGMLGKENFDAVVVANSLNGYKEKPHPHGLEECLTLLGSQKSDSVYIGNAPEDIETAKNAGIFDVLILRGEHELQGVNPSLTINSLYDLKELT